MPPIVEFIVFCAFKSSATIITLAKCVVQSTWPLSTLYRLFGKSRAGAQVFRFCEDEQFSL